MIPRRSPSPSLPFPSSAVFARYVSTPSALHSLLQQHPHARRRTGPRAAPALTPLPPCLPVSQRWTTQSTPPRLRPLCVFPLLQSLLSTQTKKCVSFRPFQSRHLTPVQIFLLYTAKAQYEASEASRATPASLGFVQATVDLVPISLTVVEPVRAAEASTTTAKKARGKQKVPLKQVEIELQLHQDLDSLRNRKGDTGAFTLCDLSRAHSPLSST